MDDRYLVVYPRGFIGVSTSGLNKETNNASLSSQFNNIRYNRQVEEESTEVYNLNITKIYHSLIDGIATNDKMRLAKAIIAEAYRNFGSKDFDYWVGLQRNSRYFTLNQQNFIVDTLRFISTGKRDISLTTWDIALKRELIDDRQSVSLNRDFDKLVNGFYNSPGMDDKPITNNLDRIIPEWLSHRGGLDDLLITLNMIFGKSTNRSIR